MSAHNAMQAKHNCMKSANNAMSGGASHNAMSGGAMAKPETNCDTHMQHNNSMSHANNMSGQHDSMGH
jgi:hypothetical protein